jgi:hypothetical protein
VTSDGLLFHPNEGSGALARPCLVQGLACSSHNSDESLLLLVRNSGDGSRDRGVVLLPLGGGSGLLSVDVGEVGGVVRHNRQDGG